MSSDMRGCQTGGIPETQMVAKLSCRFHGMSLPHSSVHMTDCLMDAKLKIIPLSFACLFKVSALSSHLFLQDCLSALSDGRS